MNKMQELGGAQKITLGKFSEANPLANRSPVTRKLLKTKGKKQKDPAAPAPLGELGEVDGSVAPSPPTSIGDLS